MNSRALTVVTLSVLAVLSGCSSSGGTTEPSREAVGRAKSAVIKGKPSDASQDSVVLLVHYDPKNHGFGECTGTLLAPRLVLTARHCVARTDPYAACDVDGTPLGAGEVYGNHRADTMYVFLGNDRPDFGRGEVDFAGQGMKILDDGVDNLCNHDIALVVLKEPIDNAPIAPIRLDEDVQLGETITAVGWGVTERSPRPEVRQQRTGVKILSVGPDDDVLPAVPPNEFRVGESICSGDSGGPGFSAETGAVVGVVSRGGNQTGRDEDDPAAQCVEGENLYTKVAPFRDLILRGYELAEAEPWLEGEPDPRLLKPGSACTDASECRSSLCLADPSADGATTCAQDCSEGTCPEGMTCEIEGEAHVCRAPKVDNGAKAGEGGVCSYSPASPHAPASVVFALAAIAVAASRRRRAA